LDFELLRYPAVALFSSALMLEATLTAKLFFEKENLAMGAAMKWWAVLALAMMSMANCYAAIGTYKAPLLDRDLLALSLFCISGLVLLVWVYVFHLDKWKAK
jgi:hypothetical protein